MNTQQKNKKQQSPRRQTLSLAWKIFLPIAIGLAVVVWLFKREFNPEVWHSIHFDGRVIGCILLAWLFMLGRDFGLTWRFRTLTDRQLSWTKAWKVDMLCEFTSCVTPLGCRRQCPRYDISQPRGHRAWAGDHADDDNTVSRRTFFRGLASYNHADSPLSRTFRLRTRRIHSRTAICFLGSLCRDFRLDHNSFLGIIVRPHAIHRFLNWLFHFRLLNKWAKQVDSLGTNMETTGKELRTRPFIWWLETFGGTALSWSSRYLVVNALFLGFAPAASQIVVFARQFIVWVCLMVSPTPGSAGISEWLFTTYYGDLIHSAGMALVIALFWRIISYYVYLLVGACIMPGWIQQGIRNKEQDKH